MQKHNYRLSELEDMIPWERILYLDMLEKYLEQQEKQ